ncbi:MAG TPA: cyclic beta 1-2 glucan synthetase, partial [Burkholderiaceae bacterium]|nr:cyclic beta 1-2 glucan synthetase [Burkholderiaceae bacterium]
GDWNDGMNKVGIEGKGESIWLGFFLYDVLLQFARLAQSHADPEFASRCQAEAAQLQRNLEQHGWDGAWYRRAYFDDGSVLGSSANAECRIDSIAQSWAVLSGAAEPARAYLAMEAVRRQLVQPDGAVLKLLAPPFDTSTPDPGYIQAYVPGVRENGAQYTHAAIWAVMAFAALGDGSRATQLLSMINPVNHTFDRESMARYKVEPYVVASDVYALAPHIGRGGWSWYSGSAGWMLRLMTESILGLRRVADRLYLEPCLAADWNGFRMRYRYGETWYSIRVLQTGAPSGVAAGRTWLTVDGTPQSDPAIPLMDDRQLHAVELRIRRGPKQQDAQP